MSTVVDLASQGFTGLVSDARRDTGRVLVISPHLDDAALSVGATLALLAKQGTHVEVLTLFAGEPSGELSGAAKHFHDLCRHPYDSSAIRMRQIEDRAAMAVLGAHPRYAEFLDAVYRKDTTGNWLCLDNEGMFSSSLPVELALELALTRFIRDTCDEVRPDLILTCSGNGHHVDHRHTFAACVLAAQEIGVPVLAWEDLPYAVGLEPTAPLPLLRLMFVASDLASWDSKWTAISAYSSQVRMLWGDSDWTTLLDRHARSRNSGGAAAEVMWRVPTDDFVRGGK